LLAQTWPSCSTREKKKAKEESARPHDTALGIFFGQSTGIELCNLLSIRNVSYAQYGKGVSQSAAHWGRRRRLQVSPRPKKNAI
jgi:hypothetical protein